MNKYIKNIKMESNRCNKRARERERERGTETRVFFLCSADGERKRTKSDSENEVRANVVCFNLVYCLRRRLIFYCFSY